LTFSRKQLIDYKKWRIEGLDRKSSNWMNKAAEIVWNCTRGIVSKETMDSVRYIALTKYKSVYSQRKVLYFTKGLLKYLTKTSFYTRFGAFVLFLEMPKVLKTRKHVTSRIVTKEDIENVLKAIEKAFSIGRIDNAHYLNYKAIVLFGAFKGQRPLATIARLTAGQFEEAVKKKKKKGKIALHAVTTTVCAARSPIRCLLSDVHIRIAPSKNGTMYGIASMISSKERTSAST
jgi:hypothetical protein